jgi:hypothetical protein
MVWKERPSARVWGITASLAYLFIYSQPVLIGSKFVWWHSFFDFLFGVLGLLIFYVNADQDAQIKVLGSDSTPVERH